LWKPEGQVYIGFEVYSGLIENIADKGLLIWKMGGTFAVLNKIT
jgi:hypothetical protein